MGAILETQRELREVLNDGVKPRDLQRKSCLQVVTKTLPYRLQRSSTNRCLH